jgi:uncharacterized protein (TIGR02996 family)
MQDEEALFQAILDNPDDEALRLVYADFLEERGDPRAEFIRVQSALAHLGAGDPRRPELEFRESLLLTAHQRDWDRPLHQILADAHTGLVGQISPPRGLASRNDVVRWEYQRGFVEVIWAHARAFVQFADFLFRLGPLQHARIWGALEMIGDLASLFQLGRLKTLDLCNNGLGFSELRVLANSPHLGQLATLDLTANPLREEAIQGLRTRTFFGRHPSLEIIFEEDIEIGDGPDADL